MPLKLFLMRHAQSADKQPGQPDKQRELTTQGHQDAMHMGRFLIRENYFPEYVLSSSATRAISTTELITGTLKLSTEKIQFNDEVYDASIRTLLEQVKNLSDQFASVLVVAHNPAISYLAEYLTQAEIGDIKPAGIVIMEFEFSKWSQVDHGTGKLIQYIYPPCFNATYFL